MWIAFCHQMQSSVVRSYFCISIIQWAFFSTFIRCERYLKLAMKRMKRERVKDRLDFDINRSLFSYFYRWEAQSVCGGRLELNTRNAVWTANGHVNKVSDFWCIMLSEDFLLLKASERLDINDGVRSLFLRGPSVNEMLKQESFHHSLKHETSKVKEFRFILILCQAQLMFLSWFLSKNEIIS